MCLNHQSLAELGVSHSYTDDLHVGDADIEGLQKVGVPDKAHVGHKECAKIALFTGQIPHPIDLQKPGFQQLLCDKTRDAGKCCAFRANVLLLRGLLLMQACAAWGKVGDADQAALKSRKSQKSLLPVLRAYPYVHACCYAVTCE